jgi:energy-coupling factor transporter ATP-binding protein EcfA2
MVSFESVQKEIGVRLVQFQVKDFRSVDTSGWLTVDEVTALIGVNESGKTNLLLPLWKLNPAREGAIEPTSDYPKPKFGEIRAAPQNYWFIEAEFVLGPVAQSVGQLAGLPLTEASRVRVKRYFDGSYRIVFPEHDSSATVPADEIGALVTKHRSAILATTAMKSEETFCKQVATALNGTLADLKDARPLTPKALAAIRDRIKQTLPAEPEEASTIVPLVGGLIAALDQKHSKIQAGPANERAGVKEAVLQALPKFVYYSNYGNLDSEIYLPHVVQNLEREDLGSKEAAKARTLRVLFSFVKLSAQDILALGSDTLPAKTEVSETTPVGPGMIERKKKSRSWWQPAPVNRQPTEKDLEQIGDQKRTRSILLQSAGTDLTKQFKDWWQQGDYRFRFEADGNFFRIWVSDARRPAEVELENRSTGLQWFLSFYLVFLVESRGEHKGAVLLLDEPGVSLHPLAQRDLSAFFDRLGTTNQIIYTSHSPFLVDADRLDRARKVYVASDGTTKVTANLGGFEGTDTQKGAAYAVQSTLNLNVAESLLLDCHPVLVEAPSDQHYLATIKTLLVANGRITPQRELVFSPSGGANTAPIIAGILTGRDDILPVILLDSNDSGRALAKSLRKGHYANAPERVLDLGALTGVTEAEIEDLFPAAFLAEEMDRIERTAEVRLADIIKDGLPFVGQVEAWAAAEGLKLRAGWKVDLAIRVKKRALKVGLKGFDDSVADRWVKVFEAFES